MEAQYERKKKFIINVLYIVLIGLIAYVLFKYALGLVSPFVFAFMFAYLLKKPSRFVAEKLRLPKRLVAVIFVLVFYSTIGVILSLAGIKIVSVATNIITELPVIYDEQLEPFLMNRFDVIEQAIYRLDPALVTVINDGFNQFASDLGDNISNISMSLVAAVSNIASALPGLVINLLLMIISTFFIAADFETLTQFIKRQFTGKGNDLIMRIKHYLIDTLLVVIRSYAIIMSITFVELAIGLSIIRIPNAILIAMIIALFDVLPIMGTGGVMIPWIIISYIQGDTQLALGLLIVYGIVTVVRNIIEPKIVGSQLGLHPIVTLMCMFIGGSLFGAAGLFGLPIVVSLLKHLNDTGALKVYK